MTTPATGPNSSMKPTRSTTRKQKIRLPADSLCRQPDSVCCIRCAYPVGGTAGASRDRIGSRDANGRRTTTTSATTKTPSAMPDSTSWT